GMVQPLGFASTGVFLADGLARFGVGADFIQISPYKTAADPLAKPKMTPEFREQVTWLLDSQHGELLSAIAESRKLDEAGAKDLIDGSPYGDDVAVEKHAADRVVGEEELPSLLGGRIGTWEQAAGKMRGPAPSLQRGKYVALMRIEGTIIDGPSTLTGSIGVLTGKIVTGAMWQKLLFNRETIAFGDRVTLYSDERPFSDEERSLVREDVERIYRAFVDIVARARKMTPDE